MYEVIFRGGCGGKLARNYFRTEHFPQEIEQSNVVFRFLPSFFFFFFLTESGVRYKRGS